MAEQIFYGFFEDQNADPDYSPPRDAPPWLRLLAKYHLSDRWLFTED
jgi:hypothetical protein